METTSLSNDNAAQVEEEKTNGQNDEDQEMDDDVEDQEIKEQNFEKQKVEKNVKKKKPGIIYLGSLPPNMNVTKVRQVFSQFGELGRIFLKPEESDNPKDSTKKKKKKKLILHFTEGWVEFKSKSIAKKIALKLNNTIIGGKKRSKLYDYMWNIKYLPGFKWVHLNERLAYERAVHNQKLRAEIARAKQEASFYAVNLERSKKLKNKKTENKISNKFLQKQTLNEILSSKKNKEKENERKEFLKSLFSDAQS